MRDGIFSFYIRSEETAIRAIALVENDSIRGFNRSHIYSIERLEYSLNRLRKDRNTNWRVKATAYTRQGVSMRGFPAKLEARGVQLNPRIARALEHGEVIFYCGV